MKRIAFMVLAFVTLASCSSDPINKKISKDSFNDDVKAIKEKHASEYTESDFTEFREDASNKITAQIMGINKSEAITYKQILDTVKTQRLRDDSVINQYNADVKKLNDALVMKIDSGMYLKGPNGEGYVYKLSWENNTDKKIIAIEGSFKVKSPLDEVIKTIYLKQSASILPKEKASTGAVDNILPGDKADALSKFEFKNLSVNWTPEKIAYEDGSKLIAPEKPYALTKREEK